MKKDKIAFVSLIMSLVCLTVLEFYLSKQCDDIAKKYQIMSIQLKNIEEQVKEIMKKYHFNDNNKD